MARIHLCKSLGSISEQYIEAQEITLNVIEEAPEPVQVLAQCSKMGHKVD